ncbi:hypothetical protein [Alloprevotella tannerae]|nr:hypothetical protein [Alloprevotella tannerae]
MILIVYGLPRPNDSLFPPNHRLLPPNHSLGRANNGRLGLEWNFID